MTNTIMHAILWSWLLVVLAIAITKFFVFWAIMCHVFLLFSQCTHAALQLLKCRYALPGDMPLFKLPA